MSEEKEYIIKEIMPKFNDRTFGNYIKNRLAGDFAYQLAEYDKKLKAENEELEIKREVCLQEVVNLGIKNSKLEKRIKDAEKQLQNAQKRESELKEWLNFTTEQFREDLRQGKQQNLSMPSTESALRRNLDVLSKIDRIEEKYK